MLNHVGKLNLTITRAMRSSLDARWSSANLSRAILVAPFSRLYYPLAGEGFALHHGRRFELRPGKLFLIPPYSQLELGCESRLDKYWAHFNAFLPNSALDLFSVCACEYELEAREPELTQALFRKLVGRYAEPREPGAAPSPLDVECLYALGVLISPFLACAKGMGQAGAPAMLLRIVDYVELNVHRRLKLQDFSREFHLSPTYLSNLFAARMGVPLIVYCNQRRMQLAMNLLRGTGYSVSEIADKVGFTHVANFCKLFKGHTTVYPGEFRRLPPDDPILMGMVAWHRPAYEPEWS